eukprot:CAMPEP_0118959730 /NCGR_PEP_ID=MMETSP1169-20130426/63280_1 /TAXON_ID=36882 /ORGANISM="Pyramimonas obovata, Strain CCMP722" /LENGTH=112 /DNA_ID=CAMNT_0006907869 /DNA_START=726 /DNA_END=1061 /DNA_ORIENTATION=+
MDSDIPAEVWRKHYNESSERSAAFLHDRRHSDEAGADGIEPTGSDESKLHAGGNGGSRGIGLGKRVTPDHMKKQVLVAASLYSSAAKDASRASDEGPTPISTMVKQRLAQGD